MIYEKRKFRPDYENAVAAAKRVKPARLPMYEHSIGDNVMAAVTGRAVPHRNDGTAAEDAEFFAYYADFLTMMGYDVMPYEICVGSALVGGGSLGGHKPPTIRDRADFEAYPWDEIPHRFAALADHNFPIIQSVLPPGMKVVGGCGNGVFELAQDLCGYMELCYMLNDDPRLFADIFERVGSMIYATWSGFLDKYSDVICINRFGDDLGYKIDTLLPPQTVKKHIIPQYEKIIAMIKQKSRKPFLLHSCGNLKAVMDDLIDRAKIDAKHSNEDVIAPFTELVERYVGRVALFGGVDTDVLCDISAADLDGYMDTLLEAVGESPGIALGCGNSIANYVSPDRYVRMTEKIRTFRGE